MCILGWNFQEVCQRWKGYNSIGPSSAAVSDVKLSSGQIGSFLKDTFYEGTYQV